MSRISLALRHRAAARAVAAVAAALAAVAIPAAASAATGSYTLNDWTGQPSLYNRFIWSIGPQLSPPAGLPSNAVVTGVSASTSWSNSAPSGFYYQHAICFGSTSQCWIFSSSGANYWAIPETPVTGAFDASTTSIIYGARVTDGTNPSIKPAISPPIYLLPSHSITIHYSF